MGLVVIRLATVGNGPRALYNVLLTCPAVLLFLSLHSKSHQDYLEILCVWTSKFFFCEKKNPIQQGTVVLLRTHSNATVTASYT
jgi:hypothetical protein